MVTIVSRAAFAFGEVKGEVRGLTFGMTVDGDVIKRALGLRAGNPLGYSDAEWTRRAVFGEFVKHTIRVEGLPFDMPTAESPMDEIEAAYLVWCDMPAEMDEEGRTLLDYWDDAIGDVLTPSDDSDLEKPTAANLDKRKKKTSPTSETNSGNELKPESDENS